MDEDDVRRIALGLDGTEERTHHGFPSFRSDRRIFATLPDEEHLHLMLPEGDISAAVAEWPGWCEEKWWGRKLTAVRIDLAACDDEVVAELIADAWRTSR